MELETWNKEKLNYKLTEICSGVFVYSYQKTIDSTDPEHWLCANCYNKSKKSIIQLKYKTSSGTYYICNQCKTEICDHSKKDTSLGEIVDKWDPFETPD